MAFQNGLIVPQLRLQRFGCGDVREGDHDAVNPVVQCAVGHDAHREPASAARADELSAELNRRIAEWEKEREKLTIYLHKGAAGEWNFDALSDFELPDLLAWGFDERELQLGGFDLDGDKPDEGDFIALGYQAAAVVI